MTGRAFREKIDMAVFGPHPAFTRLSFRLFVDPVSSSTAGPGAGVAADALAKASARAAAALRSSDPRLRAWRDAYADVGLSPETPSPVEILLAWARQPGGVPSQGSIRDLVNAFMLDHVLPAAAYDLASLQGDLWLRPSRGCEVFVAPGEARPDTPEINELILVDSAEQVLARDWHGLQGATAAAGPATTDLLVHLDLLGPDEDEWSRLVEDFVARARDLLGAAPDMRRMTWETPEANWPEPAG